MGGYAIFGRNTMDKIRLRACVERVYRDAAGATTSGLIYLGVKTGLFDAMRGKGPLSIAEVSSSAGLNSRYIEEWLKGMVAAEYLDYEPSSKTFELPDEHAYLFASEGTDHYVGGLFQGMPGLLHAAPGVADAFRNGGGIRYTDFHPEVHESVDMMNRGIYRQRLCDEWLPAVPGLAEKLSDGGTALDLGCGVGTVTLTLAESFPSGRFVGVDLHEPSIVQAEEVAKSAGVEARTEFQANPIELLPEEQQFDLITAFDCVHDLADPVGVLNSIRRRLKPDGTFLVLEIKAADCLEDNIHAIGAMFYGFSMFHCMTQSLAEGGPGLGACLGPSRTEALMKEAGFTRFEPIKIRSPVNLLYAVGH